MIVPANLTVIKSGLYRLRANLYSGTSPLAHLAPAVRGFRFRSMRQLGLLLALH